MIAVVDPASSDAAAAAVDGCRCRCIAVVVGHGSSAVDDCVPDQKLLGCVAAPG